jgi:hypothetical protein
VLRLLSELIDESDESDEIELADDESEILDTELLDRVRV